MTRVGKFLRDYHLDELPQLWNVFRGDMSFVGPRPERKYYINQITEQDARYPYLYQIRPGVTSYATLYNGYTDTIEKMLRRFRIRSLLFRASFVVVRYQNFGQHFSEYHIRKKILMPVNYLLFCHCLQSYNNKFLSCFTFSRHLFSIIVELIPYKLFETLFIKT